MWRKQSEVKPSSSSTGSFDSPSFAPPAGSAPASSSPSISSFSGGSSPSVDSTILTRGIRIKGDLAGKGEITIDGELIGSVHVSEARVAVGPNGHVKADIEAREVVVRGNVEGNLRGRDRVVLGATGSVKGDIDAARVVIEDGAIFRGRVEIGRETLQRHEQEARKSAPAPAAQTAPAPKPAAPVAAPPKPAPTPVQTLSAPNTSATTPSSASVSSSTSSSTAGKEPVSTPAGSSGGSR